MTQQEKVSVPSRGAGTTRNTRAPETLTAAGAMTVREGPRTSHATDEAFGLDSRPATTVMFSPTHASHGDPAVFKGQGLPLVDESQGALEQPGRRVADREKALSGLVGSRVVDLGFIIQQWLLEVVPLRSQSMGKRTENSLFPLPTSSESLLDALPDLNPP